MTEKVESSVSELQAIWYSLKSNEKDRLLTFASLVMVRMEAKKPNPDLVPIETVIRNGRSVPATLETYLIFVAKGIIEIIVDGESTQIKFANQEMYTYLRRMINNKR